MRVSSVLSSDSELILFKMTCKDCTIDFNTPPSPKLQSGKNIGLVFAGVAGGTALLLSAICVPFVTPALRRIVLPYVPATTQQVENIFIGLKSRSGTLIDLGSGDGRIVIEAAKRGFQAKGIELNPWLVLYSKLNALRHGVSSHATFQRKDIFKTSLRPYDNVVIFGVDCMMEEIQTKCQTEMKPDSAVAACRFPLPDTKPNLVIGEGIDKVWIYSKKP